MQFQQLLNDPWPLIVVVCPLTFLFVGSHVVRALTSVMSLVFIISILRKQNEQKQAPKPQGAAA